MTGANPAYYLPGVIDWLERGLAMARRLADEREPDPAKRCFAYNHLVDALGLRFTEKFGARVGARGDIVRVQACGVVATSIQGLNGALRNWLVAARKTTETVATAAQMGATLQ